MFAVSTYAVSLVQEILGCGIRDLERAFEIADEAGIEEDRLIARIGEVFRETGEVDPVRLALQEAVEEACNYVMEIVGMDLRPYLWIEGHYLGTQIVGDRVAVETLLRKFDDEGLSESKALGYVLRELYINPLENPLEVSVRWTQGSLKRP